MKAAMNSALTFQYMMAGGGSTLARHGVNGWQFGDGYENGSEEECDKHDFEALKDVLTRR